MFGAVWLGRCGWGGAAGVKVGDGLTVGVWGVSLSALRMVGTRAAPAPTLRNRRSLCVYYHCFLPAGTHKGL